MKIKKQNIEEIKAAKLRVRDGDYRDHPGLHFFASDGGNWTVGENFTDVVQRLGRENKKGMTWSGHYRVYVVFLHKSTNYQISHDTQKPVLKRGQLKLIGEFKHRLTPKQERQYKERYGVTA